MRTRLTVLKKRFEKMTLKKMKFRLLRKPAQPDKIFIAGFQNRFGNRNDRE